VRLDSITSSELGPLDRGALARRPRADQPQSKRRHPVLPPEVPGGAQTCRRPQSMGLPIVKCEVETRVAVEMDWAAIMAKAAGHGYLFLSMAWGFESTRSNHSNHGKRRSDAIPRNHGDTMAERYPLISRNHGTHGNRRQLFQSGCIGSAGPGADYVRVRHINGAGRPATMVAPRSEGPSGQELVASQV